MDESKQNGVTFREVSKLISGHESKQSVQFERLYDKLDENLKEQRKRDEVQDTRLTKVEGRADTLEKNDERIRKAFWLIFKLGLGGGGLLTTMAVLLRWVFQVPWLQGGPIP